MRPTSLAFALLFACRAGDVHYVSVAAGLDTSCAVANDGHVTCWGPHGRTQVAIDDAVEIAGNGTDECVRTRGGAVRCWGKQITIGLRPDPRGIADVSLPAPAIGVAVGGDHACALLATHEVACWGQNNYLQLGTLAVGGRTGIVPPSIVPGLRARSLAAGGATTCVVELDGHATCFGFNEYGALGTGDRKSRYAPVRVAGIDRVVDIATDGSHTCAHREDGTLWCWGDDWRWDDPEEPKPDLSPHRIKGSCTPIAADSGCSIDKAGALHCWGEAADAWPEVRVPPPCACASPAR